MVSVLWLTIIIIIIIIIIKFNIYILQINIQEDMIKIMHFTY